jgi:hypothetical protein
MKLKALIISLLLLTLAAQAEQSVILRTHAFGME